MKTAKIAPPITLDEAFALGEASMNLEGFYPEQNADYLAAKKRILAGSATTDEVIAEAIAEYKSVQQQSAA